jgi:hypothetical protein
MSDQVFYSCWGFLLITCLATCGSAALFPKTYNIVNFGALPDSKTLATEAIQETIDKCFNEGGGTVYIPVGSFLAGTIRLKNNISLFLGTEEKLYQNNDLFLIPVLCTLNKYSYCPGY